MDQSATGLRIESTSTIELRGDIDAATVPAFADVLTAVLTSPAHVARVVVDLRHVSFIDSSGLAVLIAAQHRCDNGASLRLRQPSRRVRRLLELSGLATFFDTETDIESDLDLDA